MKEEGHQEGPPPSSPTRRAPPGRQGGVVPSVMTRGGGRDELPSEDAWARGRVGSWLGTPAKARGFRCEGHCTSTPRPRERHNQVNRETSRDARVPHRPPQGPCHCLTSTFHSLSTSRPTLVCALFSSVTFIT